MLHSTLQQSTDWGNPWKKTHCKEINTYWPVKEAGSERCPYCWRVDLMVATESKQEQRITVSLLMKASLARPLSWLVKKLWMRSSRLTLHFSVRVIHPDVLNIFFQKFSAQICEGEFKAPVWSSYVWLWESDTHNHTQTWSRIHTLLTSRLWSNGSSDTQRKQPDSCKVATLCVCVGLPLQRNVSLCLFTFSLYIQSFVVKPSDTVGDLIILYCVCLFVCALLHETSE